MDSLEDQVRRMILQNAQPAFDNPLIQHPHDSQTRPVVRLPHSQNGAGHRSVDGYPSNVIDRATATHQNSQPYASAQHQPHGLPHPHNHQLRYQQQQQQRPPSLNPEAFDRNNGNHRRPAPQPKRTLYDPRENSGPRQNHGDFFMRQSHYLEQLASQQVSLVEMSVAERHEKEAFREELQSVIRQLCLSQPDNLPAVDLQCFGSFQTGFCTAGSDMDLVIVSQDVSQAPQCFSLHENDLPRALEKEFLRLGFGARLLTRTRVPIIKICQSPGPELLEKLREERRKWDELPEKEKYPHLHTEDAEKKGAVGEDAETDAIDTRQQEAGPAETTIDTMEVKTQTEALDATTAEPADNPNVDLKSPKREGGKVWTRSREAGPLDFPKTGVGIQSDINFFNPLGLHNTQLLRCYSICDPRVRPMMLFVKAWAKKRKINSAYSGTLSSYGYVLMVLHYLVNVVQPPVLPNLQGPWRPGPEYSPPSATGVQVDGWNVDFWRDEREIDHAVHHGLMSQNRDMLGTLLAGFFDYYSSQGRPPSFHWMQECLALRVPGGIMTKDQKGWTKAFSQEEEGRKVQYRYLFCIEDPFELSHNVARTVTHHGIVAIRDEFRRARRILLSVGNGHQDSRDGGLFDALTEAEEVVPVAPARSHNRMSQQTLANSGASDHDGKAHTDGNTSGRSSLNPNPHGQRGGQKSAGLVTQAPNIADNEAFPSLNSLAPRKVKAPVTSNTADEPSRTQSQSTRQPREKAQQARGKIKRAPLKMLE